MIKKKLVFLVSLIFIGISIVACSDNDNVNNLSIRNYPLNAFAVKVGDSYYHGKIDQTNRLIEIGVVEDPYTIVDVNYSLKSENATISPDPQSFIGNWKKEETVVVTTDDNQEASYTIRLTSFKELDQNVIFMDNFDTDGIPDTDKWTLCKKAGSDWDDEMSESYDQAYVKDGNLILVAEKVDGEYRAGGIDTKEKFDFTFGKVEIRAKVTAYPNGAFPAIWMMPKKFIYDGWPFCGEIDIMEHIKQESHIYQTIHTNYTYNLEIKNPPSGQTVICDYNDFNVYGVEWTEDALTFYVNGKETFSYPNLKLEDEVEKMQWPFTKDSSFYLILNMGLGGDRPNSWPGPIDDNNLPAIMEVDWVKVTELDN